MILSLNWLKFDNSEMPVASSSSSSQLSSEAEKLRLDIKLNGEFKDMELGLVRKIIETRLASRKLELEHQKNLDEDLRLYETKIKCLESKARFHKFNKMDKKLEKLKAKTTDVEKRIDEAKRRLNLYKNLDADLLAEYRQLKDDLECQEMIFKLSEDNVSL